MRLGITSSTLSPIAHRARNFPRYVPMYFLAALFARAGFPGAASTSSKSSTYTRQMRSGVPQRSFEHHLRCCRELKNCMSAPVQKRLGTRTNHGYRRCLFAFLISRICDILLSEMWTSNSCTPSSRDSSRSLRHLTPIYVSSLMRRTSRKLGDPCSLLLW